MYLCMQKDLFKIVLSWDDNTKSSQVLSYSFQVPVWTQATWWLYLDPKPCVGPFYTPAIALLKILEGKNSKLPVIALL